MSTTIIETVSFYDHSLDLLEHNGKMWIPSTQISEALGFEKRDAVTQLYSRHRDEFNDQMTCTLNLRVGDNMHKVRVFSTEGARMIGMLARTDNAKDFRKWILGILERYDHDRNVNRLRDIASGVQDHAELQSKLFELVKTLPELENYIGAVEALNYSHKHAEWVAKFFARGAKEMCTKISADMHKIMHPDLVQVIDEIQQRIVAAEKHG